MVIDNRITGKTKLIGLIGNPVEHTISPYLHNTISRDFNVDLTYVPLKVEKVNLENSIKGLKALNFLGFNITVPYKKDVMKYIDDNTKEAILMGAVNTVKNIDGRLYGYNTDAEGFYRSFKEEVGFGFKGKKVVIIGAGGSSRAIAVRIALDGASKITIINRTISNAFEIADIINNNIAKVVDCIELGKKSIPEVIGDCNIIINTTSVGLHPDVDKLPLTCRFSLKPEQVVYDIIYNPIRTKLLQKAEKAGCKAVNGLGMLFYQGIFAYEIWTGIKLNENYLKELYKTFSTILINKEEL